MDDLQPLCPNEPDVDLALRTLHQDPQQTLAVTLQETGDSWASFSELSEDVITSFNLTEANGRSYIQFKPNVQGSSGDAEEVLDYLLWTQESHEGNVDLVENSFLIPAVNLEKDAKKKGKPMIGYPFYSVIEHEITYDRSTEQYHLWYFIWAWTAKDNNSDTRIATRNYDCNLAIPFNLNQFWVVRQRDLTEFELSCAAKVLLHAVGYKITLTDKNNEDSTFLVTAQPKVVAYWPLPCASSSSSSSPSSLSSPSSPSSPSSLSLSSSSLSLSSPSLSSPSLSSPSLSSPSLSPSVSLSPSFSSVQQSSEPKSVSIPPSSSVVSSVSAVASSVASVASAVSAVSAVSSASAPAESVSVPSVSSSAAASSASAVSESAVSVSVPSVAKSSAASAVSVESASAPVPCTPFEGEIPYVSDVTFDPFLCEITKTMGTLTLENGCVCEDSGVDPAAIGEVRHVILGNKEKSGLALVLPDFKYQSRHMRWFRNKLIFEKLRWSHVITSGEVDSETFDYFAKHGIRIHLVPNVGFFKMKGVLELLCEEDSVEMLVLWEDVLEEAVTVPVPKVLVTESSDINDVGFDYVLTLNSKIQGELKADLGEISRTMLDGIVVSSYNAVKGRSHVREEIKLRSSDLLLLYLGIYEEKFLEKVLKFLPSNWKLLVTSVKESSKNPRIIVRNAEVLGDLISAADLVWVETKKFPDEVLGAIVNRKLVLTSENYFPEIDLNIVEVLETKEPNKIARRVRDLYEKPHINIYANESYVWENLTGEKVKQRWETVFLKILTEWWG